MIKDGIINVNKQQGVTSHTCVQILRRITGIRRIGHTGTLDPMTTGVLPLCIGRGTRIVEYLDLDFKKYSAEMILGIETETQDIWGETVQDQRDALLQRQQSGNGFTKEQIREAFSGFNGLIDQIPPKYSALKINGRRLYEYARAGESVDIKKRKVFIKELTINKIDLNDLSISFDVTCSKGTYIRTICQNVGEILECGGAMSNLIRLSSGIFSIEEAITIDELKALDEHGINLRIHPIDYPLTCFGKAVLNKESASRFINGGHIEMGETLIEEEPRYSYETPDFAIREEYKRAYRVYERSDGAETFLGVAFYNLEYKKLVADKVFSGR